MPYGGDAIPFPSGVRDLALYSENNSLLAIAGGDQQIHIWAFVPLSVPKELVALPAHAFAGGVAWSPDGKQLAFVGGNGELELWGVR